MGGSYQPRTVQIICETHKLYDGIRDETALKLHCCKYSNDNADAIINHDNHSKNRTA